MIHSLRMCRKLNREQMDRFKEFAEGKQSSCI